MQKLLLLLLIITISSCSTVAKKITYEKNDLKNLAADNSKNSNSFLDKYDYQKALDYLKESLKYNTMVDNISGIIFNYANMGKVYLLTKSYDTALKYYNQALEIAEKNDDINLDKEKAFVYNGIGEAYLLNKEYENAEKNFNIALKLNISDEDKAQIETNIGRIYFNKTEYSKALEYFSHSLLIYEKLYNDYKLSSAKNYSFILYFVARINLRMQKLDIAHNFIKKALEIDKLIENSSGIADDYFIFGRIYEKSDADKSIKYYNKSKAIYRLIDDINGYSETLNKLTILHYDKKEFKEFFLLKKESFLLAKSEEKNNIGKEIANLLNNEEALKVLDKSIVNEIEEKYKIYLK
ncbi:MAG TPA: tetratricopeptide repeat protein [Spirochaetota bacterium]|nr:tetratricopeptide repeat protein [Spirochaetota bacterium]